MAKISTYPVVSPEGSDIIIGTDGSNMNATKNFTAQSIADLSPPQDLQSVLDTGNTATQDINLTGGINVTGNLSVTGHFIDSDGDLGTSGQLLMATATGTNWSTPIVPNLQNVLDLGNEATSDMILHGTLNADKLSASVSIENQGIYYDAAGLPGNPGQILSSTGSGTEWIDDVTPTLQNVLDAGNTAISDMFLSGNLQVTKVDTESAYVDALRDFADSPGNAGDVLTSDGVNIYWTSPAIAAPVAGWNRFDDGVYNASNKYLLPDGAPQAMPNDGSVSVLYGPYTFYDTTTQRLAAINENDTYTITVTFVAEAPNANSTHLDFEFKSAGPTPYERISESLVFAKGNSTPQNFHMTYQYYADADFVANGVVLSITASGGDAYIWDVIYFIQRNQIAV